MMSMVMATSLFAGCGTGTGTETSASDNSKTEETGTEAAEQPTSDNPYAAYAGTTISVAAIETGYGSQMWQEVTDAFTEETGIQVEQQPRMPQGKTLYRAQLPEHDLSGFACRKPDTSGNLFDTVIGCEQQVTRRRQPNFVQVSDGRFPVQLCKTV